MAVKLPPNPSPGFRPSRPHRHRHGPKVGPGSHEHSEAPEEHVEALPVAGMMLAAKVQRLNRGHAGDFGADDHRELERLCEQLLRAAEHMAVNQAPDNPQARAEAHEAAKYQIRSLLQSLRPPEELIEEFLSLWTRYRPGQKRDRSDFARHTLMNAKVRGDVMNRQMEEAVEQADRLATERRVEAIDPDEERRQGQKDDGSDAPDPRATLKHTLRVLKKKRRDLAPAEIDDAAGKALDVMRVLRDEVAPRWAPEAQPWLLNTADTHIFQTVLAVIPDDLFRETNAWQGIQNLRAGELAFAPRADGKLQEGAAREADAREV